MKLKNTLQKAFRLYFVLVTLITILLMILGLTFDSDRTLSYQAYASPLIYGALGVIPVFIFDQEKEISVKKLILRRVIELVLIEAIFMIIAFGADSIPTEKIGVVIGIAAGIIVIYGLTILIEYLLETGESRELNEYLSNYQKGINID